MSAFEQLLENEKTRTVALETTVNAIKTKFSAIRSQHDKYVNENEVQKCRYKVSMIEERMEEMNDAVDGVLGRLQVIQGKVEARGENKLSGSEGSKLKVTMVEKREV
jgi:predicted  nucleic acid-binding Zn-ribbon protein